MEKQTRAAKKAVTHEQVLTVAADAIRQHGPDGMSVAEVMSEAGVTHGTFYAHFDSKDDLVAAALQRAAETYRAKLEQAVAQGNDGHERIQRLVETYLSMEHVADPAHGCFIAALGSEMNRDEGAVAAAFGTSVEQAIAMIQRQLDEVEGVKPVHRDRAIVSLATVVGGMILARSTDDEVQAQVILNACQQALLERTTASQGEQ